MVCHVTVELAASLPPTVIDRYSVSLAAAFIPDRKGGAKRGASAVFHTSLSGETPCCCFHRNP